MLAALQSGHVQAMIAKTAAERARNLATGREELIGVANYPALKETQFTVVPYPAADADGNEDAAITAEPLPVRRLGEPLEALRDAADAHAARTGAPPRIFLANLGTIPEFNARATFAQNFFAAGGIETLTNDGFANSADVGKAFAESGATVACICSSDANYALLAEATAQALTGAGATHVFMAGRAGDKLEAFRAAGIGSYIYMGCDAPDVLAKAHGCWASRLDGRTVMSGDRVTDNAEQQRYEMPVRGWAGLRRLPPRGRCADAGSCRGAVRARRPRPRRTSGQGDTRRHPRPRPQGRAALRVRARLHAAASRIQLIWWRGSWGGWQWTVSTLQTGHDPRRQKVVSRMDQISPLPVATKDELRVAAWAEVREFLEFQLALDCTVI